MDTPILNSKSRPTNLYLDLNFIKFNDTNLFQIYSPKPIKAITMHKYTQVHASLELEHET